MKRKSVMSLCAAVAAGGLLVGCQQPAHPPPMSGTQTLRGQEAAEQTRVTISPMPVAEPAMTRGQPIHTGVGAGAGTVGPLDPTAPGAAPGVGAGMTSGEGAVRQGTEIGVPVPPPEGFPRGAAIGGGGGLIGTGGQTIIGGAGQPGEQTQAPQAPQQGVGGTGTGAVGGAVGTDPGTGVGVGGTGTGAVGGGDAGAGGSPGVGGTGTGAGGGGAGTGGGGDD